MCPKRSKTPSRRPEAILTPPLVGKDLLWGFGCVTFYFHQWNKKYFGCVIFYFILIPPLVGTNLCVILRFFICVTFYFLQWKTVDWKHWVILVVLLIISTNGKQLLTLTLTSPLVGANLCVILVVLLFIPPMENSCFLFPPMKAVTYFNSDTTTDGCQPSCDFGCVTFYFHQWKTVGFLLWTG